MTNSIEVINLSKKYKDKEAVANINFKINEKDYIIPMAVEEPSVVAAATHMAKGTRGHQHPESCF